MKVYKDLAIFATAATSINALVFVQYTFFTTVLLGLHFFKFGNLFFYRPNISYIKCLFSKLYIDWSLVFSVKIVPSTERYDTRHGVLTLFLLETCNLYSIAGQLKQKRINRATIQDSKSQKILDLEKLVFYLY